MSVTSQLYKAARMSNNLRAASRGPVAYGKRVARRKTYGQTMKFTNRFLKSVGLQ